MDSRSNLQNHFARPLSQSTARDPRQAPIPPPPYTTLQTHTHRLQPSLNNDPFLPRRNERDDARPEPPKPMSQGPYPIGSYAASLPREALGTAMEIRDRPQDNNHTGSWMPRLGDGRADRYRHHPTEGTRSTYLSLYCVPIPSPLSPLPAESRLIGVLDVFGIHVLDSSSTGLRLMRSDLFCCGG